MKRCFGGFFATSLATALLGGCVAGPLGHVPHQNEQNLRARLDPDYAEEVRNKYEEQFYETIDPVTGRTVYITPSIDKILLRGFREQRKNILNNYESGDALYDLMEFTIRVEKEFDGIEEWIKYNFDVSDVDLGARNGGAIISFSIPWGRPYRKGRIVKPNSKPLDYLNFDVLTAKKD